MPGEDLRPHPVVAVTGSHPTLLQFRSLADQLYSDERLHGQIRKMAVDELLSHAERYRQFVPGDYSRYLREMRKAATFGDHIALQAVSDALGLVIMVLTSYEDRFLIKISPFRTTSSRTLWISFCAAEVHYNSLYAANATSSSPGPQRENFGWERASVATPVVCPMQSDRKQQAGQQQLRQRRVDLKPSAPVGLLLQTQPRVARGEGGRASPDEGGCCGLIVAFFLKKRIPIA